MDLTNLPDDLVCDCLADLKDIQELNQLFDSCETSQKIIENCVKNAKSIVGKGTTTTVVTTTSGNSSTSSLSFPGVGTNAGPNFPSAYNLNGADENGGPDSRHSNSNTPTNGNNDPVGVARENEGATTTSKEGAGATTSAKIKSPMSVANSVSIKEKSRRYEENIFDLQKQRSHKMELLSELESREEELKAALAEAKTDLFATERGIREKKTAGALRKLLYRKKFELFKRITGIRWDDSEKASGYVSLDKVSAFDLRDLEGIPLSNALWEKIESCLVTDQEILWNRR